MFGLATLGRKLFGTANDRKIKAVRPIVEKINALEPAFRAKSDAELIGTTEALKRRYAAGENLDSLLPEAFANVREAGRRALGLRAYDVQLIGGIFLHQGNIAEMKTGEGKTLAAVFPAYLNALTGRSVHIVTVNDYLARRDAEWMGKIYRRLGMSVGVVVPLQPEEEKRAAYQADVTYATNNELGFDYLRDNMKTDLAQMVQRGHYYAIVDEVDSILIDEARTPLIISGLSQKGADLYVAIDKLIPKLEPKHYHIDEKLRQVTLTEEGNELLENLLHAAGLLPPGQSMYDLESTTIVHHVMQALRAHKLLHKDQNYIVRDGRVILIDEFTGRMMIGRQLSDGLHQAVEAKEGVPIQPETVTMASITFQNYFRLYEKLAGMTGTAATEADEFKEIYNLGVVEIPTNKPVIRIDEHDQVYRTAREKYAAILAAIKEANARGQPILVGTTSIEKSERLSEILKAEGIPHNVLNARHHEREAHIIAEAGRLGAVTIATNMAGRGTDIQLGGNVEFRVLAELAANPEADPAEVRARIEAEVAEERKKVLEAGGLLVIGTERHESRRIDNQLRGRSGRQGDPGRSIFFLSLEDDLLRIFGSERLDKVLSSLGMKEGEAIIHPWVNKSLEKAQAKVEARNFDIRKTLLKFDNVMNEQRRVIFNQRLEILKAENVSETIVDMRHAVIDELIDRHLPEGSFAEQWDSEGLAAAIRDLFGLDLPIADWAQEDGVDRDVVRTRLQEKADALMAEKEAAFGAATMRQIEKQLLLQVIDQKWREHIVTLDHLRSAVNFRGFAQRDPLNEYKAEAFVLFQAMLGQLRHEITRQLARVRPLTPEEQEALLRQMQLELAAASPDGRLAEPRALPDLGGEGRPNPPSEPSVPLGDFGRLGARPRGGLAEKGRLSEARGGAGEAGTRSPRAAAGRPLPAFDENDRSTWGNPGRNDPCPCGSGKKFKHCHGRLV